MLYIIGLGLGDQKDITVNGAEAVKKCSKIFLEAYTSILGVSLQQLEETYGKKIQLAHRETVESEADSILQPAKTEDVAFLVVGDPFGATTHTDLFLRADELGVKVKVIHNASIMNAAGACGLQLYSFGATVSIPFFRDDWRPDSWYEKVQYNAAGGMHTLALLDIKVREPDFASLVRTGRTSYLPPRFMTVNEACEQLMEIEASKGLGLCGPKARAIGLARVGHDDQRIVSGTLGELARVDFGQPLHSLVLVGPHTHDLEEAMLKRYAWRGQYPLYVPKEKKEEEGGGSSSGSDSEGEGR